MMPGHANCECCIAPSDTALLEALTAPVPPKLALPRRDAVLAPLMIAAAAASGPHVTRNHYSHDFFPGVMQPLSEGSWDWTRFTGQTTGSKEATSGPQRYTYVSKQAPRSVRRQRGEVLEELEVVEGALDAQSTSRPHPISKISAGSVEVKCMARTRIPTPHGPAFLHLYHNNQDSKEHLAIVIDPAQMSNTSVPFAPPIRSTSLDSVWKEGETDMDRIIRGAYVGKLSPSTQRASSSQNTHHPKTRPASDLPPPLIRVHSECFTGETIGSMRCDCGEQLDEAIRLISQPIALPSSSSVKSIPGRGAVIYLRQEGRGIGLLSKIRAYNLQDLGHDTVTANLMLGHGADERGYDIAGAILRDLGLGANGDLGEGVRVLTNNPDKVKALEHEGLQVAERVPMIPRSWRSRNPQLLVPTPTLPTDAFGKLSLAEDRMVGATLIGGGAVYGEDLDKYLRTKVTRMGHMLPLWLEDPEVL